MPLIDTHVHLNFDVFQGDLDSLSSRWRQAGVENLIHSCVHPQEFASIQSIAKKIPELYFAVGLHPLDSAQWEGDKTIQQILHLAACDPKVVALGEMGLDFYKDDRKEEQEEVLWQQLTIAKKLTKPVIIHCRDAAQSLREILNDFNQQEGKIEGVMHCWGGNPTETKWFLDLGFYISFSGIVTFKNAKQVQESAKIVPSDRLLIETDCPFLAPVPKRGKRNEPSYVVYVAETLAQLRKVAVAEIGEVTTANAKKLFKLGAS
jgi:TatD DNase family protein